MITAGARHLRSSLVILTLILAAAFVLDACKSERGEEKPNPAETVNNNSGSPAPSVPKIESPASAPVTATPLRSATRSPATSPGPAKSDIDSEAFPAATPLPQNNNVPQNAPLPYPGTGIGSGVGPGRGGGGIDNPNKIRRDPSKIDYNQVFSSREVDQRARLLEKPEPGYTAAARENNITGTVVLGAVFAANGQVTDIRVIHGLPDGLSDLAIAAAKRIKFEPARLNGRAVSMYIQVEYNFNLY
ncbi:MAG TPA: TonB family protein [Pyrinomonadaceae bacterium]|nr:TonB family protein [Pyrinomonadaceae bacterium]